MNGQWARNDLPTANDGLVRFQGAPRAIVRIRDAAGRCAALLLALLMIVIGSGGTLAAPLKIVAFGDSLTAGYNLPQDASFAAQLQAALRARGHEVEVIQGGVSGDTTADGLARLDWTVQPGTDGVIVELGANDALRGIDPAEMRKNLDAILARLKERHVPAFLAGMLAPRNLGADYAKSFDATYPALAQKYGVPLYPFFLDGVAGNPKLNLSDGLHPTREGVAIIVKAMLPAIEAWIRTLKPA